MYIIELDYVVDVYVSICEHNDVYVSICEHNDGVSICEHNDVYVSYDRTRSYVY